MNAAVQVVTAFPRLRNDMTIAHAQIEQTGKMPPAAGLACDVVLDIEMCYVLHLMRDRRSAEASMLIDGLLYDGPQPGMLAFPFRGKTICARRARRLST